LTIVDPVDLLAFGPHPDDIEIGLAGTVAVHAARGDRVGLCDLTRGELGSNGTPDEREREAEDARQVLGATWRINLRWPDGGIVGSDAQIADVVRLVRQCRPRTVALPYWDDRHPDHRAASEVLRRAVFRSGLRRFAVDGAPDGDAWKPEWICYYFINDSAPVSFRRRRLRALPAQARCARVSSLAVRAERAGQRRDAADLAALPADDREP
jgi:bacillithiol biosynthesis deacetylase BshB1